MPKNDCPKNVQNPLGSKTSYNGSNKALFESKIQTKKQYSLRAVEQKIFIFMNCTRNLKKTKGIWLFYTFIWENNQKFDAKKSILQFLI